MSLAPFIAPALFLIGGCVYLVILIAVACTVWSLSRKLRLRFTLLLRPPAVRPDGDPLEDWEIPAFASIQRGWKTSADEPEYDSEGERWDS